MIGTVGVQHFAKGDGSPVSVFGQTILFKVIGEQTDGAYVMGVAEIPSQGGPLAIHTHPFPETFYVVSGSLEFSTMQNEEIVKLAVRAGEVVHVPAGVPHTFRNVSSRSCTLLGISTPKLVSFFEDVDGLFEHGVAPDWAKLNPILARHGVSLAGEPALR